ncbi:MAG: HAD family hydrolase [Thermoplasmatota archaeon]
MSRFAEESAGRPGSLDRLGSAALHSGTAPRTRPADLALVSLDLDGTLIKPAIFNAVADALGFGEPLRASLEAYYAGRMTLEEAFAHDYALLVGRRVADLHHALVDNPAWTAGIPEGVALLRKAGIRVVVTTDQPRFLVEFLTRFGVTDFVCSNAEVVDGRVAPHVEHLSDKWVGLRAFLDRAHIPSARVAHVGNGPNDISIFANVGFAVAVNPEKPAVAAAADAVIPQLSDLRDAVRLLC